MISSLPDLTATPTAPKSAIAPPEMIGKATFPALLGGLQAPSVKPAQGDGNLVTQPVVGQNVDPDERLGLPTSPKALPKAENGKAFPQGGTALPSDLQVSKGSLIPIPRRGSEPVLTRSTEQRPAVLGTRDETIVASLNLPQRGTTAALSIEANSPADQSSVADDQSSASANPITLGYVSDPSAQQLLTASNEIYEGALLQTLARDTASSRGPVASDSDPYLRAGSASVLAQSDADLAANTKPTPALPPAPVAAPVPASLQSGRLPKAAPGRVDPGPANTQAEVGSEKRVRSATQTQTQPTSPIQPIPAAQVTPVTSAEAQVDADTSRNAPQTNLNASNAPAPASAQPTQAPLESSLLQQAASQSQVAASPLNAQTLTPAPLTDAGTAFRLAPQLESTIEQLTQTRSDAQANKPELTVRHQEFGAITMRLDASGNDLRATLSARDPGFVPAIQTALAERSVAASGETSGSANQRGNEQSNSQANSQSNSFSGSHTGAHGQGAQFGAHYGSSTGGGQGTSQPYTGQTGPQDEDTASDRANPAGHRGGSTGDGERFA